MSRIASIGAGNVGRSWAIVFARAGHEVTLYDQDPDIVAKAAVPMLAQGLRDLEAEGLIEDAEAALTRIHPAASLAEAVDGVSYVQESVREDVGVKRTLFAELDRIAPVDAILASSTSAIPGSTFLEAMPRGLVVHPVNPPHLVPLVELCVTPWTSAETLATARTLMEQVGQVPIELSREIEGFILNRLQFTMMGEALRLVGEGYCTPGDIDKVLTSGLARRWALLGPFATVHLNATQGFAGFVHHLEGMMRRIGAGARPDYPWDAALVARIHAELAAAVPVEQVPAEQAARDRRLMRLAKFLGEEGSARER